MGATKTHETSSEHHGANGHARLSVPNVVAGVKTADERVVAFVQARPVAALCAAAAVGYVIGRIFTKLT
jgi:ElaB/YqjD/DUF883 family membrane-anchored ribosome-binding protein